MQTFLPYPDFIETAKCLDRLRLGKQRVEAFTLLRMLSGELRGSGYRHHPAVKMWRGYEDSLAVYYNVMLTEWAGRGYRNIKLQPCEIAISEKNIYKPHWFGDSAFHAAHRSNLLAKDPAWYGQFGWEEEPGLPYIWPKGRQ